MKSLNELICGTDSAWLVIEQWLSQTTKPVQVLSVNKTQTGKVLVHQTHCFTQNTTDKTISTAYQYENPFSPISSVK